MEPLLIKDWQVGVADSPNLGFGLMRNIDIESFPGAIKVQKKMVTYFTPVISSTFTATAATDLITVPSATNPYEGQAVTVSSTGTLPAGLTAATNYFIIPVSSNTWKLATNITNARAATAIDITSAGTGVHTITTVNPGTMKSRATNTSGINLMQDSNGRVWYFTSGSGFLLNGNTLTNASGNGLVTFLNSDSSQEYLIVFRSGNVDICAISGGGLGNANFENPTWTNGWQTPKATALGTVHYCIVGQDNIMYFCDGRYVSTILEKAGSVFDPANAATYTFTQGTLALPQSESANWLEELGTNLLVGGNKIYPWDRISVSFSLPINTPERGVSRMKNIGNIVYILAGNRGNIYYTLGSYVRFVKKIPDYISNNASTLTSTVITWGDIGARNGALVFGVGTTTAGNSGVYLLYPDGRLVQENTPSASSTNATVIIGADEYYVIGYAGGADAPSTTNRYASYETVVQSQLYRVADKTKKAKYSQVEVQIAKPASTGHVRISWRPDENSTFTVIATYTCDGVTTSFSTDVGLIDIENIQVQVEMDGDVELMQVQFNP